MEQDKLDEELAQNREAYQRLRDTIRRDCAGKYVAIAFGKLVHAGPDFDDACAAVNRLEPKPEHYLVFPADEDPAFEIIESTYREFLEMRQLCSTAGVDGRYWFGMRVANRTVRFLLDLGFIDPTQMVGLELEPVLYDSLKAAGQFRRSRTRTWGDASGANHQVDSGELDAQLLDPSTGIRLGPKVSLFATRGFPNMPNRVGVVFFHLLRGCSVWELDTRTWSINIP